MMQATKNTRLIFCALFAALTAILSQIAIPLGPVPFNLATLAVFLTGGILGAKYGAASQLVYVLLGAAGVPVFSLFRGGAAMLIGPTGGYIVGYIAAAAVVGLFAERGRSIPRLVCGMAAGLAACYFLGTAWFMISTGSGLLRSLLICVVPFLVGDALKIAVAAIAVRRLAPVLRVTAAGN